MKILSPIIVALVLSACTTHSPSPTEGGPIKAYNLDFNWGEGGPNAFARPGLWADASPKEHIKWYKDLGVNTIQTFCVSCNGYAWYKNGVIPAQPGLKYDFLPEMVRLAHKEGISVFGYYCIGSNTRWGLENPDFSYGIPADQHIPFTRKYLQYLDTAIREAVGKTGIDGFMIDWFYQPNRAANGGEWLASEKDRFQELMGKPFPGKDSLSETDYDAYSRLAIAKTWDVIHKAAKETNPDCKIWLTCFDITHPHIINSKMFQEIDWLMNEGGDLKKIEEIRSMVGPKTRLITCLANWNKQDAKTVAINAIKSGIGLYGFAKPNPNSLLPDADYYLRKPIDSFSGDDRNIATFARVYNDRPLDFIRRK
ncbi:MAG: hypothetical protein WC699_05930 [Bacteroidales bacterium]|jgi:hypothetical protein